MASEYEIKKQICDLGKRMYEKGFVAANDGNISARKKRSITRSAISDAFIFKFFGAGNF